MKDEKELQKALELVEMALTKQVKLQPPMPDEMEEALKGCKQCLYWMIGHPKGETFRKVLGLISEATDGPDYNPQQSISA